jgi:hypothetical protein
LDVGALPDELQGTTGIISTLLHHGEVVVTRADLVDAARREAVHEQRDIAMVPEVLCPEAGICSDLPTTR